MSQKNYFKILQWGIFASFLGFFLINNNWIYPYNTPKQIFFNILMEVLAVVWLALVVKYPEARPQKSWLTWGFIAWLGVILLTCFTGVDFNLSFWGETNRMLGWFSLIHFFVFYVIIITVFKTKQDWQKLFNLSLISAFLMVAYSLLKKDENIIDVGSTVNMSNNISTLGHATHVAGVMIFCFFFALLGFLHKKNFGQKIVYALGGIVALVGFFYADVSGSQAGLAMGLVIFALLYIFLGAGKKTKKYGLAGLATFIIAIALLFSFRNAPLLNNRVGKIFRDFSLQNTNLNTRMYAWRAGLKGWQEKPILGWGYGDFGIVYDKFFEGSYYRYTMEEEYFDRAHNNLIDLGSTTGSIGLAIYLSIFVFIGFYLIKGYRQKKFGWQEFTIATALMAAYFIHNLAVFDFWGTYFMFFLTTAWIFSLYQGQEESVQTTKISRSGFTNPELLVYFIGGAFSIFLIFNYNLAFAKNFKNTITLTDILRTTPQGSELLAFYKEPFKRNTPMDRSSIEIVSDFVDGTSESLANLSKSEKKEFLDYLIDLDKKVVALNPGNSLSQARLARTYMTACLSLEDKSYCQQVFEPAAKSMATGGQHIPVYRVKSIAQLYLNDIDGAVATLNQALKIYDNYTEVNCQLARIYVKLKTTNETDRALGKEYMKKCVAGGGGQDFKEGQDKALSDEYKNAEETIKNETEAKKFSEKSQAYENLLKEFLRYKGEGDMGNRDSYYKAIDILNQAISLSEGKVWIPYLNLGNLYKILGDYEQADANYNKALEISNGDSIVYAQKIELYELYAKKSPTEIREVYKKALTTLNGGNSNIMISYANWARDNGYLEDAYNAFTNLSKAFPNNKTYPEEAAKVKLLLKK